MYSQSTQSQSVQYQYEIPSEYYHLYKRHRHDNDDASEFAAVVTLLFSLVLTIVAAEWCMWRLTSKAGYKGLSKWIWFLLLGCPLTTIWTLLVFVLVPWPVQKELKRKQQSQPTLDPIEVELRQLKKQVR